MLRKNVYWNVLVGFCLNDTVPILPVVFCGSPETNLYYCRICIAAVKVSHSSVVAHLRSAAGRKNSEPSTV